jgi:PAS domain S-box-containing protein
MSSEANAAAATDNPVSLEGQNKVLESIARGAPLATVLGQLVTIIQNECPGMLGSILLLDRDGKHLRHGAAPDLPVTYTNLIDGLLIGPKAGSCGTALFRRSPVAVEDIETDPLWEDYKAIAAQHGLRSCWSWPIFDGERRVLGTFAMYFREPGQPRTSHLRLIDVASAIASIAIVKHRAEEEMKRRQEQLNAAQSIAGVGSYEWDLRTGEVQRSAEYCRIFGLQPDEFTPTFEAYLERIHAEDRAVCQGIIESARSKWRPFDFEERIVRPDGSVRTLETHGRWVLGEGRTPVRLIATSQDITERKQATLQLEAANRALVEENRRLRS